MKFKHVSREQAHKNLWRPGYELPDHAHVGVGDDIDDRWLITNKKFRPLRDLLVVSKDQNTVELHRALQDDPALQQFILAPELAYETTVLSNQLSKDFDAVNRLLPKVMPPYPSVCVELPITEQVSGLRSVTERGQLQIRRAGAYIKTTEYVNEAMAFRFVPFFEFINGSVYASPIELFHTTNNDLMPFCQPIKIDNFGMVWNATLSPWLWKENIQQGVPPESVPKIYESDAFIAAAYEAAEEIPVLFFAWLVLVNSKSGVTASRVSPRIAPANLGRRQRFKRGRSGYTVLCLSDMEAVDSEGVVAPKPQVSAHRVRGHFKARKRGVFWWRPHVRGNGELKERSAYVIDN